jgi:hypothetical protein
MGIELKGWYLLSKEGVPSLRFQVTPAACSPFDLIAVVPWHLSYVLSGTPVAREPWVSSARHAAEFRNHWWQHVRETTDPKGISSPSGVHPYPTKDMQIADVPDHDRGGNFGRLARVTGLMTGFIASAKAQEAMGIPINDWILFLPASQRQQRPGTGDGLAPARTEQDHPGGFAPRCRPGPRAPRRPGALARAGHHRHRRVRADLGPGAGFGFTERRAR